jgi:hypothetical protein
MANEYIKRCLTILAIREMLIKSTVRYHYTPVRIPKIRNGTNTNSGRMQRKWINHALLTG